jgi:hypothetical protein
MNFKSFFFACLLAVAFSTVSLCGNALSNSAVENFRNSDQDGYTYVRVYDEDGMPWIYVYDAGGNLITTYPEV